jgi:hypothetical protein
MYFDSACDEACPINPTPVAEKDDVPQVTAPLEFFDVSDDRSTSANEDAELDVFRCAI